MLIVALLANLALPALAQDTNQIVAVGKSLEAASRDLQAVDQAFDQPTEEAERRDLRDRASTVRQSVNDAVALLEPQLAAVDARLGQLGTPTPGVTEAPDIRAQRGLLAQQRSTIDSAIKRGRLIGVEAGQLVDEINQSQAQAFGERMSAAVASPLSPGFWTATLKAAPRDIRRVMRVTAAGVTQVRQALRDDHGWQAGAGLVVALLLLGPLRLMLRRLGRERLIAHAPASRVRRSGLALWLVLVGMLLPGFAAVALMQGLRWAGMLTPAWNLVAVCFVRATFVFGLVSALGGALLLRRQQSWRLLPIGDATADALRPWTWAAAGLGFVGVMLIGFNEAVGASYAARAVADGLLAILHCVLIAGILLTIGRLRARSAGGEEEAPPASHTGLALLSLACWLLTCVSLGALLLGYVNLSLFVSRMVVWVAVVAGSLYLLLVAADDILTSVFSSESRLGRAATGGLGLRGSAVDQLGVVLSALVRLLLVALGVSMMVSPFGSNVGNLFDQATMVAQGVTIGQITISPGAILRSLLVLAAGLFVVRGVQRWLTTRYLPTTELDDGARNSISMVARYTGVILAALWALASLGIGVERIALLLSALSVGIGFGLQAITQNFVSGLILLAERPVKIGDLVRIGDQEGDVKKISVRATEIQIADRSTLIVPNSELITKTIRNMTLANPIGRIQLLFSVQLDADTDRVRAILKDMFREAEHVLDDPEPKIFLDSIIDGRINFNCFAYVASPRDAYPTRSEMLFQLLRRMPAAGIDLGTAHQQIELLGLPDSVRGAKDTPGGLPG
ncbi:mechanosensitive ion channel family protein [Sphingomonas solaris]|uniref:Mechanosensitive ion channel family protein n=1 Tax=Alterirhizorhabdus solaris TaxID=2529389 RepID=A0A558QSC1_9SPHN|nr:mechanosensitive ion channel family protein [Sphingomonas solaris]